MENWFIPLIDEINELNRQNIIITFSLKNLKIINGIIFWMVDKNIHEIQFNLSMTDGTQKWSGDTPNFKKTDNIKIKYIIFFQIISEIKIKEKRIIVEEILCTKKYKIIDFSVFLPSFIIKIGIIADRLISKLIQIEI